MMSPWGLTCHRDIFELIEGNFVERQEAAGEFFELRSFLIEHLDFFGQFFEFRPGFGIDENFRFDEKKKVDNVGLVRAKFVKGVNSNVDLCNEILLAGDLSFEFFGFSLVSENLLELVGKSGPETAVCAPFDEIGEDFRHDDRICFQAGIEEARAIKKADVLHRGVKPL